MDLPQPLSPTRPSVSPRAEREGHAVHRAHSRASPRASVSSTPRATGKCFVRPSPRSSAHAGTAPRRRMQAAWCAGSPSSGGGAVRQASLGDSAQRGAKAQPGGSASQRAAPCPRSRGSRAAVVVDAAASPCEQRRACRDGAAREERSAPGRSPRCGRHTSPRRGRRQPATTPRSWRDQQHRHARPRAAARASRSRICAWIVTSSAVVGSSAISSAGPQASAMAIIDALAHAARELVRVVLDAARGIGDADAVEQLDRARAAPRRGRRGHGCVSTSAICSPMVQTG